MQEYHLESLFGGGNRNPSPQNIYLLCVFCCLLFIFIDHVFEGNECISVYCTDDQKGDLYFNILVFVPV